MGKRTTTRHKEDNTFRFQTFEDKLKNISVNVNLSIRDGRGDLPDEEATFFHLEIEKWIDLNRTESFGDLLTEIGMDVKTLPQILLQKDRLATVFLAHLSNMANSGSFEPAFALTVALSRDLGQEFYPYFPKFFKTIVDIVITSKNPEIIENGFKCYAYLSKYLRRQIVRDIPQHLKLFAPLLSPKLKNYVVIFACEAFEVVVSKFARDKPDEFLNLVFKLMLQGKAENSIGVATLLFAMFKSVGGSLKIKTQGFNLVACMNYIYKLSEEDSIIWFDMLKILVAKLLNHANENDCKGLFEIFENILLDPCKRSASSPIFRLYSILVCHESCSRLPDLSKAINVLKILTSFVVTEKSILAEYTSIILTLIERKGKSSNPEILSTLKPTLLKLLEVCETVEDVSRIDTALQDTTHYFHAYLVPIVQAYERVELGNTETSTVKENEQNQPENQSDVLDNKAIWCISRAVVRHNGFYHVSNKSEESKEHFFTGFSSPMIFYGSQKRLIRPLNLGSVLTKNNFDCCEVMSAAHASLDRCFSIPKLTQLFLSLSRMAMSVECSYCIDKTIQIATKLIDLHEVCEDSKKSQLSMIMFLIFETLATRESYVVYDLDIGKYLNSLEGIIMSGNKGDDPFCLWGLKCLDFLVHFVTFFTSGKNLNKEKEAEMKQKVLEFVKKNREGLLTNLMSGFKIVRSLTLSILTNALITNNSEVEPDPKMAEMLGKFREIEDMSLLNPKFSSLVKSAMTECKVLMESASSSEDIKKLCLKYTIGLLYSNFNLIWNICIEVIQLAGKNMKFSSFWEIFGFHFKIHFPESSSGSPRLALLNDEEEIADELVTTLKSLTFGFPPDVKDKLGLHETLDIAQYRVNIWKSIVGVPFGKPEYQEIKYIIDKSIANSFDGTDAERGFTGELNRTLVPMFEFLEKCDHTNADLALWEKSLNHLISAQEVQKAVWEFLHAKRKNKLKGFKADVDELIKSDSMDVYHKFRIDAIDTTMNKQYQNESMEKRGLLMDIVLRVLIGKERRWKAEKRLQALRFIGGCTDSDARKYLELTVGPGLKELRISPKAIEVKINKIASCIRCWRYKFPAILEELLSLLCDLTVAIPNLKKPFPKHSSEEELPTAVFEEQKKSALKSARLAIVAFFTFLAKFNLDEIIIQRIFDVFVWAGLEELKTHTGSSPSWIMKLFLVWSSHERFHILFTKCRDNNPQSSSMQSIFDLLENSNCNFEIRKYLMGILLNLATPPEIVDKLEDEDQINVSHPLDYSEKFDARPLAPTGVHQFNNSEEIGIGINIVLYGKSVILQLFQDSALFRRFVSQPGGDRCLSLISRIAEFVSESEADSIVKLCSILIETFPMYKTSEENLYHCLVACKNLMENVPEPKPMLLKLATSFTWISGRRLRAALCDILSSQKDEFLSSSIIEMNAWMDLAVDTPDFSKRQGAFQSVEKALTSTSKFDRVLFTLTSANCFYGLLHETDIGMRNSAKNLLIVIASALKSINSSANASDELRKEIHQYLESSIIPRLRGGIHHKDDNRFADFLQVYIAFIQQGRELHGTFKELDKVLNPEIIEGLHDIQIHLRTRAMNKLCKKLSEVGSNVSPTILKNFVLPLANHNLLDEEKLGKNNNELIDASIEVMKTILCFLPHEQYFKHMGQILDNPMKKTKLAKQYERILVAIMDSFHFDLSLATATGPLPTQSSNSGAIAVETAKEEKEDDDESHSEEETAEAEETAKSSEQKPLFEITVVQKTAAMKCLNLLKTILIPKLRSYLNFEEKATHKLSRADKTVDSDVILKIPCTLALVKLLKKLPKSEGDSSLRSIIPCLCAGLRNELFSTRNSLRKTLLSVVKELGVSQFRSVISYLKSTLQRGYQKHVLNYTVGYLMKCLESELKRSPEQLPIKEVLPLCEEELYGVMQEEKELAKIKAKTREASKSNAVPILKLAAKCVQARGALWSLIDPAVKHLAGKRTPKVAKATRQWLNAIGEGLADNIAIDHLELISWLREVLDKEALEDETAQNSTEPESKKRKLLVESKDAFLIPQTKKKPTADGKLTGQFLLSEFGFNCLYNGLNKNSGLKNALLDRGSVQVLDAFVKKLGEGIQAKSKQVNIVSLRCLTLLFEFELESFKNNELLDGLRRSGFIAMNNHCYRTSSDVQMTNATFKFLTAFFVRFPDYKIIVQDFELMLKCIQSYLTNGECSSAAITLLKGVLKNKFKSPNLQELMEEVFKQSIQSYYQHINEGCRQAYYIYLNNYCTTPKELSMQVRLILNQYDYTTENGRLAAVEIMNSLLGTMPMKSLEEIKELVFLKTLSSLDKEGQPTVREKLCEVLKSLFRNEGKKSLVMLFLKLLNSDKHISELDTFLLIAGVLIEDPNIITGNDFAQLLEKIEEILNPESFETLTEKCVEMSQQAQDYAVYQSLVCLKKALARSFNGYHLWERSSPHAQTMKAILGHLRDTHFLYEHEWVPLITLDIFSIICDKMHLTEAEVQEKLTTQLVSDSEGNNIMLSCSDDLKTLLKNIWTMMKFSELEDVLMKGTVILVQLTCVAARLSDLSIFEETIGDVRNSVNHEVVNDQKNTTIRSVAFGCFRGVVKGSPIEAIMKVAEPMTRVAVRELTDEGISAEIKQEAEKLTTTLRLVLGNSEFNALFAKVNDYYHKKRNLNRAKKKETFVLHPGLVRKRPKKSNDAKIPFKKSKKSKKFN